MSDDLPKFGTYSTCTGQAVEDTSVWFFESGFIVSVTSYMRWLDCSENRRNNPPQKTRLLPPYTIDHREARRQRVFPSLTIFSCPLTLGFLPDWRERHQASVNNVRMCGRSCAPATSSGLFAGFDGTRHGRVDYIRCTQTLREVSRIVRKYDKRIFARA